MQVVKVRIRRGDWQAGEDQMVYPPRYNAAQVEFEGVGPGRMAGGSMSAYSGHIGRGGDEEWCFVALPDELAAEYTQDPDMEAVTEEQAEADMEAWRIERGDPAEIVTDPNRMLAIIAKTAANVALSQDDLDSLDPTKGIKGVNLAIRPLSETLAAAKAAEAVKLDAARSP